MPETLSEAPETEKDRLPAMGFLEHLEELRRRIIYSLIAMVVGFFACWGYAEKIYDFVQQPIMQALRKNGLEQKLVYLNPTDGFNLYLKTAFRGGALPYLALCALPGVGFHRSRPLPAREEIRFPLRVPDRNSVLAAAGLSATRSSSRLLWTS